MISNISNLLQSPEAAEGCVTVNYSLAGHPSQNQLHFSLKPAEDAGYIDVFPVITNVTNCLQMLNFITFYRQTKTIAKD